jgi:hypothetical protein
VPVNPTKVLSSVPAGWHAAALARSICGTASAAAIAENPLRCGQYHAASMPDSHMHNSGGVHACMSLTISLYPPCVEVCSRYGKGHTFLRITTGVGYCVGYGWCYKGRGSVAGVASNLMLWVGCRY